MGATSLVAGSAGQRPVTPVRRANGENHQATGHLLDFFSMAVDGLPG
jgi:hypothetical protein